MKGRTATDVWGAGKLTFLYREFRTVEELDQQYEVARSVPDAGSYVPRFAAASAEAAARPDATLGVAYGLTTDEYLDIYPAEGARSPSPVFMFIHGGYWKAFSARNFAFAATGPTQRGLLTVVPNYTLAPEASLAEIVRQMRAAIVWTVKNIQRFGGDPSRIVVGGHSAGGHLAAMAALTDWHRYGFDRNPVTSVLGISGLYDLRPFPFTYLAPWLQLSSFDLNRLSPQLHPLAPELPPFMLGYGGAETTEFHRQSEDFATRLRAAGHSATTLILEGENHLDAVLGLAGSDTALTRHLASIAA
jgi:arylformamidase